MQANFKLFNELTMSVLNHLYNRFPAKTKVGMEVLRGSGAFVTENQFAAYVMSWLQSEGLVRIGEEEGVEFHDCELTAKGVAFLHTEVCTETGLTMINRIKSCQEKACFNCLDIGLIR